MQVVQSFEKLVHNVLFVDLLQTALVDCSVEIGVHMLEDYVDVPA